MAEGRAESTGAYANSGKVVKHCQAWPRRRSGVFEPLSSVNKPSASSHYVSSVSLVPYNREQSKKVPCWCSLPSGDILSFEEQPQNLHEETCHMPHREGPGPLAHLLLRHSVRRRPSVLYFLNGVPVCRCLNKQH